VSAYEGPLPIVDPDSAPYWRGAAQGRLVVPRCTSCHRMVFFPRVLCPFCYADTFVWEESRGQGSIYSYTVARRPAGPAFAASAPYVVALIDIDEGFRMLSTVRGCAPDTVQIGARVAVRFQQVAPSLALPVFNLQESGDA
jgi:uncharacterized OB-fold protein